MSKGYIVFINDVANDSLHTYRYPETEAEAIAQANHITLMTWGEVGGVATINTPSRTTVGKGTVFAAIEKRDVEIEIVIYPADGNDHLAYLPADYSYEYPDEGLAISVTFSSHQNVGRDYYVDAKAEIIEIDSGDTVFFAVDRIQSSNSGHYLVDDFLRYGEEMVEICKMRYPFLHQYI